MSASPIAKSPVRVWDAFVRAFHWSLALSVGVAWITAGEWDKAARGRWVMSRERLSPRASYGAFWDPVTRVLRQFVSPPPVVVAYLKAIAAGTERRYVGHNPAGAAMIVAAARGNRRDRDNGLASHDRRFLGWRPMELLHSALANGVLVAGRRPCRGCRARKLAPSREPRSRDGHRRQARAGACGRRLTSIVRRMSAAR